MRTGIVGQSRLGIRPELLETYPKPDPDSLLAYLTARFVKMLPKLPDMVPFQGRLKVSCEQQAIPHRDAIDRMVRYESLAERGLRKALDRLEIL